MSCLKDDFGLLVFLVIHPLLHLVALTAWQVGPDDATHPRQCFFWAEDSIELLAGHDVLRKLNKVLLQDHQVVRGRRSQGGVSGHEWELGGGLTQRLNQREALALPDARLKQRHAQLQVTES